MIIKNKDFVWIYNGSENRIDWGVVMDDVVVMQYGGFYALDDFDEALVATPVPNSTNLCYIGGIVRYATSFNAAKAYYYHWLTECDRFVDHHTEMCVIAHGDDFVTENDRAMYLEIFNSPLQISVDELESYFDREVHIIS